MLFRKAPAAPNQLLADTSNIEELRAQRVWRLSNVAWCTWLFFTGYCWLRGYLPAATVCFLEVIVILAVLRAHRGKADYRRIMNLILGACATGLLFVSLSDRALHHTMLFYPVSILIASQLLGIRAALQWLVVCLTANTIYFLFAYSLRGFVVATHVDELTIIYGVAVCVFFCCHQGEEFYRERTKGLVNLSCKLRRKGKRLQKLATTDSLTKLLNRFQLQRELEHEVRHASHGHQRMALLMIDMDGFKEINDTLGHPVGDQALVEIARRLRNEFQDEAVVARLGGDEFCLIFRDLGSVDQAATIAGRACGLLTTRYIIDEFEFPMGASAGIALCPDHTTSPTDLLAYADTAMFVAKDKKLGHTVYTPDMTERLVEYRIMQEQLSRALDRNEFFLVYQPQVQLATGKVIGVEALLRWRHGGQVISPARFVPLLEKSREIIAVGRWIVRDACRQLREWNDAGYDVSVSINLSAVQFNDNDFFRYITSPIEEFQLDPRQLDFEITESLLVDDVNQATQRLTQLKMLGVSISIDDFGTGYSSLAYLRQFPLDRLKIDRAFVKDIPDDDDGVIARSIVVLAKALGLKVLAEGVETKAQLEFLQSLDCDECQGYLLNPPASAEEASKFFAIANPSSQLPLHLAVLA